MFGNFNKYHVLNGKRTIDIFFVALKVTFAQKEIKEKKIPNPLHLLIT